MSTRTRILIAHQGAELYGSDRMVVQLTKALSENPDFDVDIHIPHDGPLVSKLKPYIRDITVKPISILRLASLKSAQWLNIMAFVRNLFVAWKQMRSHDIVVVNTCVVLSYLLLLPFYRRRKFVYVHEIPTGFIKWGFNILLALTGATLMCNSQATTLAYPLVTLRHKMVVHNTAPHTMTASTDYRSSLPVHIAVIGRISPRKGHDVLLRALAFLEKHNPGCFRLRIIGEAYGRQTAYHQQLGRFIRENNLGKQIEFHPFTNDPAEHYNWADCVVIPSTQPESFGLVALEAMLAGKPVIASAIGALPEIIEHDKTGLLVNPDDDQSLAAALLMYAQRPNRRADHGRNGLAKALSDFSFDTYRTKIMTIFTTSETAASSKTSLLERLLHLCGKNYTPDPALPQLYTTSVILGRALNMVRGLIMTRACIFRDCGVGITGRSNITFGKWVTLDKDVKINAIAKNKISFGNSVRIGDYTQILCTAHMSKVGTGFSIGDQSGCGQFCFFGAAGGITIGRNVIMGQYVSMHAQDHIYDDPDTLIQNQGTVEKGIVIGDDCWIGAKVTILDGTNIGNHCVIAAGAVVKGEFPSHVVIGGVPAKIIKTIE